MALWGAVIAIAAFDAAFLLHRRRSCANAELHRVNVHEAMGERTTIISPNRVVDGGGEDASNIAHYFSGIKIHRIAIRVVFVIANAIGVDRKIGTWTVQTTENSGQL